MQALASIKHVDPIKEKTTKEKINNTLTEELILGICAPIGSKKENVISALKSRLEDYAYEVIVIKVSDFINELMPVDTSKVGGQTPAYTSLMGKINNGNSLRKGKNHSVLAEYTIMKIHRDRLEGGDTVLENHEFKSRRICYIIDSIKNKEELALFRSVYNGIFYLFSIFSPTKEREETLINKNLSKDEAEKLINADEYENNSFGQNVRNTFVDGDFFVRVSNDNLKSLNEKIERYVHIIFKSKIINPLSSEIAMHQAKSAAGNSACLSRQVGAVITDIKGGIISSGWNDVPKFGGNLYSDDDAGNDHRCKSKNFLCSNDSKKDDLAAQIIESLKKDAKFASLLQQKEDNDSIYEIIRNSTKIKDLIEFSRSVHAEMHAIIIGSQLAGTKMIGGKLYCTTYPCHNCARHIIVAGITEIYYIEPYVKSLCKELHWDAMTENENETDKVKILIYDGVAPRRFLEFFMMNSDRKNNGKLIDVDITKVKPNSMISLQALPTLEQQAIHTLDTYNL